MPRYVPSYVDTSGFIKALNDEAYRNQTLAIKREDAIAKHADDMLSTFTKQIRPVDIPKFTDMWREYKDAGKLYMKDNRMNTSSETLSVNSMKQTDMMARINAFAEKSISWKGKGVAAAKMFKDGNKVVDQKKYVKFQDDINTRTSDELDEEYGSSDKVDLSQFEFKPDEINMQRLNNGIKSGIVNPVLNGFKKINTTDAQNNRVKVSRTMQFGNMKATFDVPQTTIVLGPEPNDMYRSVMKSSINPDASTSYKWYFNKIMSGLNSDNPAVAQQSKLAIDKTSQMFNISDPKNITPEHLYASSLINEDMYGTMQIDDWSEVDDMLNRFAKMNNLKLDDLRMKKLKKDIEEETGKDGISQLLKLLTVVDKTYKTGVMGEGNWSQHIMSTIQSQYPNLKVDNKLMEQMGVYKFDKGLNMFGNWMQTQPGYTPQNPNNSQR